MKMSCKGILSTDRFESNRWDTWHHMWRFRNCFGTKQFYHCRL